MGETFDVARAEEQARTAGFRDGLIELFAAVVLTSMAIMWMLNPALIGIGAALIVVYGWKVVERVKERVTYPRIGYFREKPEAPETTARGMLLFLAFSFLLMVVAVAANGGLTDSSEWQRAAPLMSGISLAGGFWYTGDRSGLLRHRLIAAYSVVTGVMLWLLGVGEAYEAMVWHLLGLAVPLAAIGVWGLMSFTRTHPIQGVNSDG